MLLVIGASRPTVIAVLDALRSLAAVPYAARSAVVLNLASLADTAGVSRAVYAEQIVPRFDGIVLPADWAADSSAYVACESARRHSLPVHMHNGDAQSLERFVVERHGFAEGGFAGSAWAGRWGRDVSASIRRAGCSADCRRDRLAPGVEKITITTPKLGAPAEDAHLKPSPPALIPAGFLLPPSKA